MAEEAMPRGLFVSMIENSPVLADRNEINALVVFAKKAKVKVLYVQVYRANKTWFPSRVGDQSLYDASFKKVGDDPLAVLIKRAHKAGIEVHAWLNLLSLSTNKDAPLLKRYGTGILTRNLDKKNSLEDYKIDNQYFLEPGDPKVRMDLGRLVAELVHRYPDLDGIQFDYIRYPDVHPRYGHTPINELRFKKATGLKEVLDDSPAWQKWKRDQVTQLLTQLVRKIHAINPRMQVSTTGCVSYSRAMLEAFQDWPSWVDSGLVDFVTVMNYPPDVETYQKNIVDAHKRVKDPRKLNMAVGAYKFLKTPEEFSKQLNVCEASGGRSCAVFYYGNMLENPVLGKRLINGEEGQ